MNKKEVRTLIKEKRREHIDQVENFNDQVSKNLALLISELNPKENGHEMCLGGFSPLGDEPIWWKSLDWDKISKLALVHMHDEIKLTYHQVDPKDLMNRRTKLKLESISEEIVPDIILIPGIAFDSKLDRLGRGKGYFDSFLEKYKGIKIGVFFSYQEIEDIPVEAHDEKLDFIVTNKNIIRRG